MSALEERSSLDQALEAAQPHVGEVVEQGLERADGAASRVRERVKETADHPLSAALKKRAAADPEGVAGVYFSALEATKRVYLGDQWSDEPDHNVRLKAADSISNRVLGLPTARTELTGLDGGPLTLAAVLAADAADAY